MRTYLGKTLRIFIGLLPIVLFVSAAGNNSPSTATTIGLNIICVDSISRADISNWYTFTLNNAGKINISFYSEMMDSNQDLYRITVYNASNLENSLITWFIKGYTTESNITTLGLPQGKYYINIVSNGYWRSWPDYRFIVSYTRTDYWEKEFNDNWRNATPIELNQQYHGAISRSNDNDWYTFTLNNAGKVNITFYLAMRDNNEEFYRINVYNALNPDNSLVNRVIKGYTTETNITTLGLPQGKYYIRIESSGNWWSSADYGFIVNYTRTDYWEREVNDNWRNATPIELNQQYHGAISRSNDNDWYTFTLNSAGIINITFLSERMSNNENFYRINVYNALNPDNSLVNRVIKGYTTETNIDPINLSQGKYYVKIESGNWWSGSDYKFTVKILK